MNTPAPAASVLLLRPGTTEPEIFLVQRSPRLRFLGGFTAFPGGKVDADDGATPIEAARCAAARELFEEAGVLLATRADGTFLTASDDLATWRRDVLAGTRSFGALLAEYHLHLDPKNLPLVGHLVTPPFSPQRFDTAFVVADLPPGQSAEVWPGELDSGQWSSARAALDAWKLGEMLLSPPTVALLQVLAGNAKAEIFAVARAEMERIERGQPLALWFSPGLRLLPLLAPALPPARYTNALLVGNGPLYLIDPGATDASEQARLFGVLDAESRPLTAVILSHHHIDHVGAAQVVADRYGLPVWAHADAARLLADQVTISRHLADGERLDLGESPRGGPWHLEAILTPGHAPGHLAFFLPQERILLAGDMVSTLSSVLVAPPDGNLRQYLDSLARLQLLGSRLLLPAHGGPSSLPERLIRETIEHRHLRERQLLEALSQGERTLADLVPEVYRGVASDLWPLAELQLLGNLVKLLEEGRVTHQGADDCGPWRMK